MQQPVAAAAGQDKYPVFPLVVFIIALLLCLLRGVVFGFSILGMMVLPADSPLGGTVLAEVITGGAMFLFGVIGYGLMLAKKSIGVPFAWVEIAATIGNMIVGLIQAPITFEMQGFQGPQLTGAWVGTVVVMLIRLAIVVTVAVAILRFSAWMKQRQML